MTLLELAERCEKATGPDRELNAAIGSALYQMKVGREVPGIEGCAHEPVTASLDAATQLVPEGWRWMAGQREFPHCRAYVENGELAFAGAGMRRNPKRKWFEVTAATPALALCAAALRARAAQIGDHNDR